MFFNPLSQTNSSNIPNYVPSPRTPGGSTPKVLPFQERSPSRRNVTTRRLLSPEILQSGSPVSPQMNVIHFDFGTPIQSPVKENNQGTNWLALRTMIAKELKRQIKGESTNISLQLFHDLDQWKRKIEQSKKEKSEYENRQYAEQKKLSVFEAMVKKIESEKNEWARSMPNVDSNFEHSYDFTFLNSMKSTSKPAPLPTNELASVFFFFDQLQLHWQRTLNVFSHTSYEESEVMKSCLQKIRQGNSISLFDISNL